MRVLLFTGKGGVGKTTIAAATALEAARRGYKTLILSTDPAHSLADALDTTLGPEPTEVVPGLFGQELDVYYSIRKYYSNVRELVLQIFRWQGVEQVMAEELSALPGMEEASAFLWLEEFTRVGDYELIVIDSAPTGETLTLLTLPQVSRWWMTRAFPFQKSAMKAGGAFVRTWTGIPVDKGYEELELLYDRLERVQTLFSDPQVASIRLVTNPERMVIQEAKRAFTYLQLYGYNVDAVIANRVLPPEAGQGIFAKYMEKQGAYLEMIRKGFEPLPVFEVPHRGGEVFGAEELEDIGNALYTDQDPLQVFHAEKPFKLDETQTGYQLRIRLPFISASDFSVKRFGDELVIDLHNRRHNVFLPRFINFYEMQAYRYEEPWLQVDFEKPGASSSQR
jgi:arsenite-transporting ATPase